MEHAAWKRFGAPALVLLLAGVTVFAQLRADTSRPTRKDELVYLPNEKLLTHFTAGMSSVIADLLWLRCIQFTGAEFKAEHDFAWLSQMLNTIVRMDPYFKDVYRYGAIFLAGVKADDTAGLDLLHRGIIQRPDAWELPYEAAMIFLLNRRDTPDSQKLAALYLAMSASTGRSPQMVANVASALQGQYNLDDIEGDMWANIQKNGDKVLRELAERKQAELRIRQGLPTLNDNIDRFAREAGRPPKDLAEILDRGYFGPDAQKNHDMVLKDTLGGTYFIDADGKAKNTTLLDGAKEKALGNLRGAITKYHDARNAYPLNLSDVVPDYLRDMPAHPYAGKEWEYNPATGEVNG